jgi:hypothetical protein
MQYLQEIVKNNRMKCADELGDYFKYKRENLKYFMTSYFAEESKSSRALIVLGLESKLDNHLSGCNSIADLDLTINVSDSLYDFDVADNSVRPPVKSNSKRGFKYRWHKNRRDSHSMLRKCINAARNGASRAVKIILDGSIKKPEVQDNCVKNPSIQSKRPQY